MIGRHYLDDVAKQLRKYQGLAEKALAQVGDEAFFTAAHPDENSIAVVMKHVAGNMRSRWTDFLTTDGEKPDRHRDREFVIDQHDTRESVTRAWSESWSLTLSTIESLTPEDLLRTVTVRGEEHTVMEAINRQLTHYAYHVGQIVYVARQHAGDDWKSLSIPRGQSDRYEVDKDGGVYDPGDR